MLTTTWFSSGPGSAWLSPNSICFCSCSLFPQGYILYLWSLRTSHSKPNTPNYFIFCNGTSYFPLRYYRSISLFQIRKQIPWRSKWISQGTQKVKQNWYPSLYGPLTTVWLDHLMDWNKYGPRIMHLGCLPILMTSHNWNTLQMTHH